MNLVNDFDSLLLVRMGQMSNLIEFMKSLAINAGSGVDSSTAIVKHMLSATTSLRPTLGDSFQ